MTTTDRQIRGILRLAAVATTIAAIHSGAARAATVVHYDGIDTSYTGGSRAYWGGNTDPHFTLPTATDTGGEVRTWKYSDTTPISPATGYSGPAIYAALQLDTNAGSFSNLAGASGIRSGSLTYNDYVASGFAVSSGVNASTLTAMIFFKTDVAEGQSVAFDSSSSISLTGNAGNITGLRFVVQNDGQWYISNALTSTAISSPTTGRLWTLSDLDSYSFASIDPENAAPLPEAPVSGFDTPGSNFTDITAVGYYYTATGAVNNFPWISLWDFSVNATVVPEPATGAMLLLGMAACAFARRHRRK